MSAKVSWRWVRRLEGKEFAIEGAFEEPREGEGGDEEGAVVDDDAFVEFFSAEGEGDRDEDEDDRELAEFDAEVEAEESPREVG